MGYTQSALLETHVAFQTFIGRRQTEPPLHFLPFFQFFLFFV